MRKFRDDVERMRFDDVNYAWLSDFEDWMKRKELSQNTRKIHLGNIRIAMREAYKRELTENDPFRRFTFKPAKTRKRSLSLGQLRRIKDFPVEPYAEIYRDMFMLIFYLCGINIIDLYGLKEISGEGRIEYRRAKTGRLYSIKVEPEAMSIIERYRGDKALLCLADRWSDYKNFARQMNKALANIGEVKRSGLGGKKTVTPIEKDLTSYWARHTWATIAADIDIPDAVISMALGHSGENRVTDIYIDRNMRKVDVANRKVIDRVLKGDEEE